MHQSILEETNALTRPAATVRKVRAAVVGIGWWSDVLTDAALRGDTIDIAACYTRSEDKRAAFAAKYNCRAAASYDEIIADSEIEAIINTTPNSVHLATTRQAAEAGKHVFLDKPIANTVAEGCEIARVCEAAGVVLALGYQRRRENHFRWIKAEIDAGRFGKLVQAECNISRVRRVSGASAQLVLPGDNPDVANLILEHECGAISNLTASYASASEYYMMNIYGKEASAYYDLFGGLRHLRRGETQPHSVAVMPNDAIREELDEFAACIRNGTKPETDGWWASRNLAVIMAGIQSAREGRAIDVPPLTAR